MPDDEITSKMDAVERLVEMFYVERMVHLAVTTISLVMLLGSALYLIGYQIVGTSGTEWERLYALLSALFGSSGLITYSTTRLLKMWDQALDVLTDEEKERHV